MKLFFTIILLSSVLFSMETKKQIILGSYSVKTNGANAAVTLKKQIENDKKLKKFMQNNSLEVINTVISGYTVVSVNAFDSYKNLFMGMKLFQAYYDDAFVLNYPTQNIAEKEMIAEVEEKAIEEEKLEVERLEEETPEVETLEEDMVEQKRLEELAAEKLANDKRLEEERLAFKAQRLEEERRLEEEERKRELERAYSNRNKYEKNATDLSDYYLLMALAVLILIIGAIVIYNRSNKEDEDIEV